MDFDTVLLGINGLLLIIVLFLSIRLVNAATTFIWNNGDGAIQGAMKWRILKTLVLLFIIGLSAIFINIIGSWE